MFPALNNPQLGILFNMADTHFALNVSPGWAWGLGSLPGRDGRARRHLLGVWDAGMLAATFLGSKAQLLPSTELLDNSGHLQPVSEAQPAPICFALAASRLGGLWKRGVRQRQPSSAWRVCRVQAQKGVLPPHCFMWAGLDRVFVTKPPGAAAG